MIIITAVVVVAFTATVESVLRPSPPPPSRIYLCVYIILCTRFIPRNVHCSMHSMGVVIVMIILTYQLSPSHRQVFTGNLSFSFHAEFVRTLSCRTIKIQIYSATSNDSIIILRFDYYLARAMEPPIPRAGTVSGRCTSCRDSRRSSWHYVDDDKLAQGTIKVGARYKRGEFNLNRYM